MGKKCEIKDPKKQAWYEMAMSHGQAHESFTEIKLGSEQHKSWIAYFNQLGWMPFTLRNIDSNTEKSWTAPCEWPDSLPQTYLPAIAHRRPF